MFFVALLELQETLSELEGDYGLAGFNIFYFVWVLSFGDRVIWPLCLL